MEQSGSDENKNTSCAHCSEIFSTGWVQRLSKEQSLKRLQGNTSMYSSCQDSYQLDMKYLINNKVTPCVQGKVGHLQRNCTLNVDTLLTISQKVQGKDKKNAFTSLSYGSTSTLPLFKRDLSNLRSPTSSSVSGNCCINSLINMSLFVLFIHCIIVGLGRIVAGYYIIESAQIVDDIHEDVALFQIIEGFIDISIITSLLFTNVGRRKCFPVLVLTSIVCLTYGSTISWSVVSNDMFVLMSRYYSVFDWIMIVYLIVFGHYINDDDNNSRKDQSLESTQNKAKMRKLQTQFN